MNVYIELETLKRELSGKLLISLQLVKKNHNVFLGDRETITYLAKNNKIPPGVIFLKDMNTQKYRVNDYKYVGGALGKANERVKINKIKF